MPLPVIVHFETVATAFSVADIAQPILTTVSSETRVEDAVIEIATDAIGIPDIAIGLVRNDTRILGYIATDFAFDEPGQSYDGPADGAAGGYCTSISPDQIVPGTLPLLDLIPLFQTHFTFFVLTGNSLTHTVSFGNLDQLPARLGLFTLIFGLEADLLHAFTRYGGDAQTYLDRLPLQRRQKASAQAQRKSQLRPPSPEQVLIGTTFIDKITMLTNSPAFMAALPFASLSEADAFFQLLHDLRNRIAHSDSILEVLPTPAAFAACLSQLRAVMNVIGGLADDPPPPA